MDYADDSRIVYVFITFQSMNGKEKFLANFKKIKYTKCGCFKRKITGFDHLKFRDSFIPKADDAPDPSVIIWKNIEITKKRLLKN